MTKNLNWLTKEPLTAPMRRRLELALSFVVAAAAIVALSRVVRPDPSKLPVMTRAAFVPERSEKPIQRAARPTSPTVDPDFIAAVGRADLAAMEKLFKPTMPKNEMLSAAAYSGDAKAVAWVLDHGADIHEGEGTVRAPILTADAHKDITTLLLEHGAEEPSISLAATAGARNCVVRLIANHADVNPPGDSPLARVARSPQASIEDKLFITEKLLAAKANPNRDGMSEEATHLRALTSAVRACDGTGNCRALVRLLVKHHAEADVDTLVAVFSIDPPAMKDPILDEVLKASFEPGAKTHALIELQSYQSVLRWDNRPMLIKKLVGSKGVDWAWHDGEEDAALPLVSAARGHDRTMTEALLEAGAPANRVYRDDVTALGALLQELSREDTIEEGRIAEMLLARGADPNRRLPDGRTPLFAAAESGHIRIINALINHGARVNETVIDDTALNAAEQNGQTAAARVIHARGGRRGVGGRPWSQ